MGNITFFNKNMTHVSSCTLAWTTADLFLVSFDANVETSQVEFKMEITELQCDADLRNIFRYVRLIHFYTIQLLKGKFPDVSEQTGRIKSLFGSAYICEHSFPEVNIKEWAR
jgi:hypothetical protein